MPDNHPSSHDATQRPGPGTFRRAILSLCGFSLVLAITMFLPAGDMRWMEGWAFLLVFFVLMVLSVLYLWHINPEIFVARSKIHEGTKRWDKMLLVVLLSSLAAVFPLAGLDAGRFHWSTLPPWLIGLGYVLLLVGMVMSVWVYGVNKFAEPGVRIQTERGQKVVDSGPYAIVRHPLYLASLFLFAGIPLALGSYWALIPAIIAAVVLVVRTVLEDRTLQNELEGYEEYTGRVRYRLLPGIW